MLCVISVLENACDRRESGAVKIFYFIGVERLWRKKLMNQVSVREDNAWKPVLVTELLVLVAVNVINNYVVRRSHLLRCVDCHLHVRPASEYNQLVLVF